MPNVRVYLTGLGLIVLGYFCKAQDFHSSINEANKILLNPAFTGCYNGLHRFGMQFRNQWYQVPVSYKTLMVGAETKIIPYLGKAHRLGIGLCIVQDKAGDIGYSTSSVLLSASYHHIFGKDSTIGLSWGCSFGIHQTRFNTSDMTFDLQFDGFGYNPALSGGENFSANRGTYPDWSTGLLLRKRFESQQWVLGFSAAHVNSPKIIFEQVRLGRRYVISIQDQIRYNSDWSLLPSLQIQFQGINREWVPGFTGILHNRSGKNSYIGLGLAYRTKDACVLAARYGTNSFIAAFAYDLNTSPFKKASRLQGAFEWQLVYCIPEKIIPIPKKIACPVGY